MEIPHTRPNKGDTSIYRTANNYDGKNVGYFDMLINKIKKHTNLKIVVNGNLKEDLAHRLVDANLLKANLQKKENTFLVINSKHGTIRCKLTDIYKTGFSNVRGNLGFFTNLQYIIQGEFFILKIYFFSFFSVMRRILFSVKPFTSFKEFTRLANSYAFEFKISNYNTFFILTLPFRIFFILDYIIHFSISTVVSWYLLRSV